MKIFKKAIAKVVTLFLPVLLFAQVAAARIPPSFFDIEEPLKMKEGLLFDFSKGRMCHLDYYKIGGRDLMNQICVPVIEGYEDTFEKIKEDYDTWRLGQAEHSENQKENVDFPDIEEGWLRGYFSDSTGENWKTCDAFVHQGRLPVEMDCKKESSHNEGKSFMPRRAPVLNP